MQNQRFTSSGIKDIRSLRLKISFFPSHFYTESGIENYPKTYWKTDGKTDRKTDGRQMGKQMGIQMGDRCGKQMGKQMRKQGQYLKFLYHSVN